MADLLNRYGVSDMAERATLLELAAHANVDSWWQAYGDVVPPWLEQYLDMERSASLIRHLDAEVDEKVDLFRVTEWVDVASHVQRMIRWEIGGPTPSLRHRNREKLRQLDDIGAAA